MEQKTEATAIFEQGLTAALPKSVDGTPFTVLPEGSKLQSLDHLLMSPQRKRGTITMRDVESFSRFVNEESSPQTTRIYGDLISGNFVAVLNDSLGEAGWRDHQVVYRCPQSVEWKTWAAKDGAAFSQELFAQFIEDNVPDVAEPPAAEMLEIARTIEAKKKVNFASGIRLSNGQNELTYEETIQGTAGKGKFVVPETFVLGLAVLEGGPKYAIDARLRYRIGDGGKLVMWYELVRPHKIIEDALKDVKQRIEELTGLKVFNGSI